MTILYRCRHARPQERETRLGWGVFVMTAISWKSGVSGNWNTKTGWSGGKVPGSADDVTIGAAGTYTVSITDAEAAHSVALKTKGATLDDTGTLALGTTLALTAGTLELDNGGVIAGGTIEALGGTLLANGGTLCGGQLPGHARSERYGENLSITNGLAFTGKTGTGAGTILDSGYYSDLSVLGTTTISNVTIDLGSTIPAAADRILTAQDQAPARC